VSTRPPKSILPAIPHIVSRTATTESDAGALAGMPSTSCQRALMASAEWKSAM